MHCIAYAEAVCVLCSSCSSTSQLQSHIFYGLLLSKHQWRRWEIAIELYYTDDVDVYVRRNHDAVNGRPTWCCSVCLLLLEYNWMTTIEWYVTEFEICNCSGLYSHFHISTWTPTNIQQLGFRRMFNVCTVCCVCCVCCAIAHNQHNHFVVVHHRASRTYTERDIFGNYYRHFLVVPPHLHPSHFPSTFRIPDCGIVNDPCAVSRRVFRFIGFCSVKWHGFERMSERERERSATAKYHFKFTARLNCFHCQATWIITINTISLPAYGNVRYGNMPLTDNCGIH